MAKSFLKNHSQGINVIQRLLDAAIVVLSFLLFGKHTSILGAQTTLLSNLLFFLTLFVFENLKVYRSWRGASFFSEFKRLFLAWLCVTGFLFVILTFTNNQTSFSNRNYIIWLILTFTSLVLLRLIARIVLRVARQYGFNTKNVIIIGANSHGLRLSQHILRHPSYGMKLIGFFDDEIEPNVKTIKTLGNIDDLKHFIRQNKIDIAYIALSQKDEGKTKKVLELFRDCSTTSVYLVPDFFMFELLHTNIEEIDGVPVFAIYSSPLSNIDSFVKRVFDICFSTISLILLAPLMIVLSLIIKITSTGPIIFRQTRYGLHGEEIEVYKFRSMSVCENGDNINQAIKNDPRITRIGSFMRKTSLDELPQFINVLLGDMSIVGPRPHAIAHNEYYRGKIDGYMLRHKVKPGITGWAQINGWRGETETMEKMEKRVEYDLEYIRNWSLWFDIKIICLTIFRGFNDSNAY